MAKADDKTGPVQGTWDTVRNWFGKFWWVAPAALLLLNLFQPDLGRSVKDGVTPNLPWWLLAEFVACAIWFGAGFFHVTNGDTPVSALRADAAISNTVQLGLVVLAIYQLSNGSLQWGVILPTLTTIADVYMTADRAINNAAYKPIVQQQVAKN
jgi:hypothetical protein